LVGALPPFSEIRSVAAAQGRFYNDQDNREARNVAFLGSDTKKQLFADREAIGQTIWLNGIPYSVIGIMKSKDQNSSYDGFDTRKSLFHSIPCVVIFPISRRRSNTVDRLLVAPWSIEDSQGLRAPASPHLGPPSSFDPRDEEAASIWDTVKNADQSHDHRRHGNFHGCRWHCHTFPGLSVADFMLVSVRERTRNRVRMALPDVRSILRQFFLETIFVVGISGGVGLFLSYGFCALVNLIPMPPFFSGMLTSWKIGAMSVTLLSIIAILSALYPANRAASVDPIEALRFEAGG
jgi:putative ABC transport system permease protein